MKRNLLTVFLCLFFANIGFCATITFTGASTNAATKDWNTASNWSSNSVPGTSDDVVIPSGKTVIVTANSTVKTVSVTGVLNLSDGVVLKVLGNFTVNSGGSFNMPGGSGLATLAVYGDYLNNGSTDFWKSNVVVAGNLYSPSTSALQNQGNIVVGGNIIGDFNLTGGTGSSQIYPINPNAIVTITPASIDSNVNPGTFPSGESQALIDLVNLVVYGGACSPAITLNSIVASDACKSNGQSTITIKSTSLSMLPVGTYTVMYDLYNNNNNLSASMTVSSAGTGVFIADVSQVNATSSANIRIKKIASSTCYTDLSSNNYSNNFYMYPILTAPVVSNGYYQCDRKWILQWNPDSLRDGYYLDVATDVNFTNFVSGYKDNYIAGGNTQSVTLSGLAYGGVYYYRLRAKSYCGVSPNSSAVKFTVAGDNSTNPGTISGGATAVCVGSSTPAFIDSGSNPSTGTWSIFEITGKANITTAGVVTGVSPGDVLVVFTTTNGSCGSSTSKPLTIGGGSISTASSAPTVCIGTAITPITHNVIGFTSVGTPITGLPSGVNANLSGNTLTISGTPTNSGTFSYSIPLTGAGCGSGTGYATGTIVVNPNLTASVSIAASPSGAICIGTSVTFTATPVNGGTAPTYKWYNKGVLISGQTAAAYTSTTLADNDVISVVMTSNIATCLSGNPASSNTITVSVSSVPAAPVLSDISNLLCSATSTNETWTQIPNITEYRFDLSADSSFGSYVTGYQNLQVAATASPNLAISGLTPGKMYYVKARTVNGSCTSADSNVATISVPITITADGTTWTNGSPDANKRAVFNGNVTVSNLDACSCQVNAGKNITVPSGGILKLENGLDVLGTGAGAGTLTFENNASLIQNNNTPNINSGTIIYKRITSNTNNFDFIYWSSPVTGQTFKELVPNTLPDKYFSFGTTNWVYELPGNTMTPGKGYIIRRPKPGVYGAPYPETVTEVYAQPVKFVGVPNNGSLSLPINPATYYNLIGNPYPSALDAKAFLTANSSKLGGTIYLWTHNTAVSSTGYASADYATFNLTGGVGTGVKAGSDSTSLLDNTTKPSGNIAAGQSFFALSTGAGPVVFDNTMRVGTSGNNAQFFRGTKSKTTAFETNRVWLNLTNTGGAFKQMLVGYVTGASNVYDSAYDGESFDGNSFVDFYSVNENKNLVIQGRGLPFDSKDTVPLGYRTTIAGTFAISIDATDGVLSSQPVFIEDKLTNTVYNLKNGPYSFTTEKGTFNDRLVLRYTDKTASDSTLGNPTFSESGKELVVSVKNHKIKINSFDETMEKVMVYDLRGSVLYQNDKVNINEFTIPNFSSSDQFLIVMIQLTNGKWVTKEIVF